MVRPALIGALMLVALAAGGAVGYWLGSHPSKKAFTAADRRAPDPGESPASRGESPSRKPPPAPLSPTEIETLLENPRSAARRKPVRQAVRLASTATSRKGNPR